LKEFKTRRELLKEPVSDYRVYEGMRVSELIECFSKAGGFMATHIARAVDILEEMCVREDCVKFLSFPACIIATGLRGVIADMIRRGLVDIIITTGGAIDHDIARSFGGLYYHGEFFMDDIMLQELGVHRLGNVLVPLESYGPLIEKVTWTILEDIQKATGRKVFSVRELLEEFGRRISDENSILRVAAEQGVRIYVPGIIDSAFGTDLFTYSQLHDFKIDLFLDMKELADIVWEAKCTGALMIGGGISKHHVIWWNQFRGGLDYAVYITTATEYDGSLSGARLREAISWGKLRKRAKFVTIEGEATVVLPLIVAALYDRLRKKS